MVLLSWSIKVWRFSIFKNSQESYLLQSSEEILNLQNREFSLKIYRNPRRFRVLILNVIYILP